MVLQFIFIKGLVEEAIRDGLLRRFSSCTRPLVVTLKPDGIVDVTTSLPSGNLTGLSHSLRGFNHVYQWLDSLERTYPRFADYLRGVGEKDVPVYHDQIDWSKR